MARSIPLTRTPPAAPARSPAAHPPQSAIQRLRISCFDPAAAQNEPQNNQDDENQANRFHSVLFLLCALCAPGVCGSIFSSQPDQALSWHLFRSFQSATPGSPGKSPHVQSTVALGTHRKLAAFPIYIPRHCCQDVSRQLPFGSVCGSRASNPGLRRRPLEGGQGGSAVGIPPPRVNVHPAFHRYGRYSFLTTSSPLARSWFIRLVALLGVPESNGV